MNNDYRAREEQLRQLRPMTRAFRKVTADFFPNPDPATSLMYAVTELGEALSAWLREQRPGDVRASKGEAVADELCDALMMLHGAMAPGDDAAKTRVIEESVERAIASHLSLQAMLIRLGWQDDVGPIYARESAIYLGNLLYDLCAERTAEIYRARLIYRIHMAADRAGFRAYQTSEVIRQWTTALATELASI